MNVLDNSHEHDGLVGVEVAGVRMGGAGRVKDGDTVVSRDEVDVWHCRERFVLRVEDKVGSGREGKERSERRPTRRR